jgi:hypothetical protein
MPYIGTEGECRHAKILFHYPNIVAKKKDIGVEIDLREHEETRARSGRLSFRR